MTSLFPRFLLNPTGVQEAKPRSFSSLYRKFKLMVFYMKCKTQCIWKSRARVFPKHITYICMHMYFVCTRVCVSIHILYIYICVCILYIHRCVYVCIYSMGTCVHMYENIVYARVCIHTLVRT